MGKYLLTYTGGAMAQTDEERQAVMAAWGTWFGTLGSAIVDPGNPCGESRSLGAASGGSLTGYTVLSADSLESATELAKGCPVLTDGGGVEVYETFEVM
jgi:hypothetical protein